MPIVSKKFLYAVKPLPQGTKHKFHRERLPFSPTSETEVRYQAAPAQGQPVHQRPVKISISEEEKIGSITLKNLITHQGLGGVRGPAYAMAHAPLSMWPVNPPEDLTHSTIVLEGTKWIGQEERYIWGY